VFVAAAGILELGKLGGFALIKEFYQRNAAAHHVTAADVAKDGPNQPPKTLDDHTASFELSKGTYRVKAGPSSPTSRLSLAPSVKGCLSRLCLLAAFEKRYGALHLPIIVIAGAGDRVVSVEHQSARLASELRDGDLLILFGLGHMLHYGATEEIERAIDNLSQTDGSVAAGHATVPAPSSASTPRP